MIELTLNFPISPFKFLLFNYQRRRSHWSLIIALFANFMQIDTFSE